ncbi:MAG: DUF4214 domain-containing protein [Clostridia bacterium]|nr:DUF4214 domain-containing protein [Clostridia bacterium]
MRKISMILALALVLCMVGGAVAEDISANPGKNVVVPINVESKDAAFSILKYTYDAKRFEYKDTTINGTIQKGYKDGQIAIADISNALNGNIGSLLFKVKDNAEKGSSLVDFTASGTFNRDEKETTLTVADQNLIVEGLVSSFVRRCYSLILGRSADEGGLNNWVSLLESGQANASQIISNFMFSPEYLNRKSPSDVTVEILYNTMLGRPSDPGGKAMWVDTLNAGGDSNAVINGFCGSQEFLGICDEYGIVAGSVGGGQQLTGIEGFVARCYSEALSRASDEGGLNYWCDKLRNKEQTPIQVAWGFVFSPEMDAQRKIVENPDALLDSLYRLYLGRPADEGGKAYWKDRIINEKLTMEALNDGFAYSQEFAGIVAGFGL